MPLTYHQSQRSGDRQAIALRLSEEDVEAPGEKKKEKKSPHFPISSRAATSIKVTRRLLTKRAVAAMRDVPPVPSGYPHWVKFFVDGGNVMAKRKVGSGRQVRGVYWSMRCEDGGKPVLVRKRDLEKFRTNNDAEWLAVREALSYAAEHHATMPIIIYSDSLLVVKQFNAEWRTKIARHHNLRSQCRTLAAQLKFVVVQWVPREVNVVKLGH